jgi:hypothetical protein
VITIVNRKNWRGVSIYVGRPTVLGNPFVIGRDGDREAVIQQYRRWLWNEIRRGAGPVFDEICRLAELAKAGDLILSCWCAPQPCHAEIIRASIEYVNRRSTTLDL